MVDDRENRDPEDKKEDSFEFDSAGEAVQYISLEQAELVAMRAASEEPGEYGQGNEGLRMVFELVEEEERGDYYVITMAFRPGGNWEGTRGQEQFFIEKQGVVAHRQVLNLPRPEGGRRFPVLWVIVGIVVVVAVAVGGVVVGGGLLDSGGADEKIAPIAAALPTETSQPVPPTLTPTPLTQVPASLAPALASLPAPVIPRTLTPVPPMQVPGPPTARSATQVLPTNTPTKPPAPILTATPIPKPLTPTAAVVPISPTVTSRLVSSATTPTSATPTPIPRNLSGGRRVVQESTTIELVPGVRLEYSLRSIQSNVGYFYRNNSQTFASLTEISPCHEQTPGYEGQVAVDTLDDLSRLEFSSQRVVIFGTRKSNCYTGLFVWRQDNRYVVVDPLEIGGNGELVFDWWIGDAGVTDFSAIASQFSNVTAVPETYFLSSVRITLATGADGTNDDLLFELLDVLEGETLFEAVLTGGLGPNSSEFFDLMIPLEFCEFSSFRLTKITGSGRVADHLALDDLSVAVDGVTVYFDRTARSLPYHGGYSGTAKYKARCEILETGDATPISVPVAVVVPTETPTATPTQIPAPIATPTPAAPVPVPQPNVTPTHTPVPPTQVPMPTPTSTPTPIPAQATVNFPDAGLDAAIRQALGKRTGQQIAVEDLADLTSLSANDKGISDLSGIELCSNLAFLSLSINQISDITPLTSLTNLTELDLQINRIGDISPLKSITNLTTLYLNDNRISDVNPLTSLTNLAYLYLKDNQISNITSLASLTNLSQLDLGSNEISDVSPLASLTNLTSLSVGNRISDVSPLASLTNLTSLNLENNQFSDISPLTSLPNLTHVYLGGNKLNQESIDIHAPNLRSAGVDLSL